MRKIFALLTIAIFAFCAVSQAQTQKGSVTGTVIDGNTRTIESASISLLKASDSTLVKMSVADKTGKFSFENVPAGRYLVSVSAVGHIQAYSEVLEVNDASLAVALRTIELVPAAKAIGGVTVTAKKPFIEQKAGKMVVNVDASPTNAGLTAMELLEKSPGVSVDNDGNISLKGKQGVMILVDGKPTYMSGADLAALLKNMQSSNIDQIEIMTNPPAKYDAAGNSGIINIKTKKGIIKGMNGSANGSYTQGLYARFNGGLNLNYRNDKLNVFGGYNGGTYQGYNDLTIYRKLVVNPDSFNTIDQKTRPHFQGVYHNVKVGMDYSFSKRDVAGIVLNGNFNTTDEDPASVANIFDDEKRLLSTIYSTSLNKRKSENFTANFNYKHTFDSTGREITTDLDYAKYVNNSNTLLSTTTAGKPGAVLLKGIIPSDINIYSAKIDYIHPFKNGIKMEAGLKSSLVKTDNEVGYQRNSGNQWLKDSLSNHFIYDENINAAYAIFSKSIKKFELTAGLRVENTNSKGHQESNDSSFNRHYTNLFPNVGVGFNANEKNQFSFSYSRRVMRPDYDDMNPFIFFLDTLTYGQGNPYLQPQFTNNFEVSHTFNRFLTTTINYTNTTDVITDILKQNTAESKTFQTKDNLSSLKQWGIAVMFNKPITKWWNVNLYTNLFNNNYKGLYNNRPIQVQFTSFQGNMTNSFTLGKGWGAEVSGWFRSKAAEGVLVANSMGAVNSALTKQVLKKKGTLKLGVRDIFYTQIFSGTARYDDVDVRIHSQRDSRQFNLSFTYRFGKTNIAPERRRSSGASDEQNRVKSGGN